MILDATNKSISITLGAAIATKNLDVVAAWADITSTTFQDGANSTTSNGTTETTIVAAPATSTTRRVKFLSVYNADTQVQTVTIKYVDGANKRIIWNGTLAVGGMLVFDGNSWSLGTLNSFTSGLGIIIDGVGAVPTTGMKGYQVVPFNCNIVGATLLLDQGGACVVDIWRCTYAQFDAGATHPVSTDAITGSSPPTIAATNSKSQDTTLSGWSTALSRGDIIGYNLNSVATATRITASLDVVKT